MRMSKRRWLLTVAILAASAFYISDWVSVWEVSAMSTLRPFNRQPLLVQQMLNVSLEALGALLYACVVAVPLQFITRWPPILVATCVFAAATLWTFLPELLIFGQIVTPSYALREGAYLAIYFAVSWGVAAIAKHKVLANLTA